MESIYIFIVFVIVSFCYIHIVNQFKTSEDLEIYEFDFKDNENLQETCNILQPVIFKREKLLSLPNLDSYKQLLMVKDTNDYYNKEINMDSIQSIELPCKSLIQLLKTDTQGHYFTENNQTFIEESGLYKKISDLDDELKPKYSIQKKYDLFMGSINTYTPLRFHTSTRKYLYILKGSIRIKMASFKFTKYLHMVKDFENLEFKSLIDVWNKNDFKDDLDKIQFIEFDEYGVL